MSTQPSQIAKFALQDILLGIAEGLNDAQQTLQELPPYDAFGRPNNMYHLPYLDFSLAVTSEFESVPVTPGSTPTSMPDSYLRFRPAQSTPKSTGEGRTEVFSTISGRFVAALPNEGLPQMILQIKQLPETLVGSEYHIDIEVDLGNAAGEKFVDATVEFNYDAETSEAVNGAAPSVAPVFTISEVSTDADGIATATIKVKNTDFTGNYMFIVLVNAGTVSKNISISNGV